MLLPTPASAPGVPPAPSAAGLDSLKTALEAIENSFNDGVPVGAGTDATRVASYNPWVSLSWLVTGKTLGGLTLYPAANRLDRETALRLWTEANTWFDRVRQERSNQGGPTRRPRGSFGRLFFRSRG